MESPIKKEICEPRQLLEPYEDTTAGDFEYRFRGGGAFTKEACIFESVYVLKEPSWHKEPFEIPMSTNSLGTILVPRSSETPSPLLPWAGSRRPEGRARLLGVGAFWGWSKRDQ